MFKQNSSIYSLLLIALVFTSCSGQTSSKQNANLTDSISKKEQNLTIFRTLSKKIENVGCQLLDKEGNLWFSILGEGAYRYDGKSFTNFTTKDGLCNNDVSSIIQSRAQELFSWELKMVYANMMELNLQPIQYPTP
jgi:hypothetical protein